jgi:hypothetical protein
MPRASFEVKHPDCTVRCLGMSQELYVYKEWVSQGLFVCKFFGSRWYLSEKERRDGLNYEFKSLNTLRSIGFCKFPHHVVRPLSKDEKINCLLVEDFVRGHDLDYYIRQGDIRRAVRSPLTEAHRACLMKRTHLNLTLAPEHLNFTMGNITMPM